jgi:hypothetical protein
VFLTLFGDSKMGIENINRQKMPPSRDIPKLSLQEQFLMGLGVGMLNTNPKANKSKSLVELTRDSELRKKSGYDGKCFSATTGKAIGAALGMLIKN